MHACLFLCFQAEGRVVGPSGETKQEPEAPQRQLHQEGEGREVSRANMSREPVSFRCCLKRNVGQISTLLCHEIKPSAALTLLFYLVNLCTCPGPTSVKILIKILILFTAWAQEDHL